MRLSEKTIELNFCAQVTASAPTPILWFGLTQKQEAAAGFDAAIKMGGRLLLFQFKASDHVLKSRDRRFHLSHHQLAALQKRAAKRPRSVFYAFPLIGNTVELSKDPSLLAQVGLLDVATLPVISPPTTGAGTPRKNQVHYADVRRWSVTIYSDPVESRLESAIELAAGGFRGSDGVALSDERVGQFDDFWRFRRGLGGTAAAAILLP
jgi:hypothetical protein